jgi:hypothetical protein
MKSVMAHSFDKPDVSKSCSKDHLNVHHFILNRAALVYGVYAGMIAFLGFVAKSSK